MEIYIPGSETRFAQTCRPCAEYKPPYIALLNYNKTLKDAKTITKHPSPANPNVGKLIYISVIYVFTYFIYYFYICGEPGYAVELI